MRPNQKFLDTVVIPILFGILVFVLLGGLQCHADSIEVLGPTALTYHPLGSDCSSFSGQVDASGCLIKNTEFGLAFTQNFDDEYQTEIVFAGTNSMGSKMFGVAYERGYEWSGLQLGLIGGAYIQDDSGFLAQGVQPFEYVRVNGNGIVPIIGGALNYKIPFGDKVFLKINNIVSPILTNSVLSIGYNF